MTVGDAQKLAKKPSILFGKRRIRKSEEPKRRGLTTEELMEGIRYK